MPKYYFAKVCSANDFVVEIRKNDTDFSFLNKKICPRFYENNIQLDFQTWISVLLKEINKQKVIDVQSQISNFFRESSTAWKVSKCGVISGLLFPHLDWIRRDMEYLSIFTLNVGKYKPEKTPHLGTFHAVSYLWIVLKNLIFAYYYLLQKNSNLSLLTGDLKHT